MQTYFIGIKGTNFFCYDSLSVPACMCSVTNNWLCVAFSSRVESGSDNQKIGSIGSLDGSSRSYQQTNIFGCYLDSS